MMPTWRSVILTILLFISFVHGVLGLLWTNNQPSNLLLGQPGYSTCSNPHPEFPTARTFGWLMGLSIDNVGRKLWVASGSYFGTQGRVLRFSLDTMTAFCDAELVLGQAGLTAQANNSAVQVSPSRMLDPRGVTVDRRGGLWVADAASNRIMYFNNSAAITTNGAAAGKVIGQPDLNSGNANRGQGAASRNSLSWPNKAMVDSEDNLWVTDSSNNRVLMFRNIFQRLDSDTGTGDLDADLVLGQANFTTRGSSLGGLSDPVGVVMIGRSLFVSDRGANRILRWDGASDRSNGDPPDGVLGQPNFNTGSPYAIGQSGLNYPGSMTADAQGNLYVADYNNNRALVFVGAKGLANGAGATYVFGQADLSDTGGAGCTQTGNALAGGLALDERGCNLFIAAQFQGRVMRHSASVCCVALNKTCGRGVMDENCSCDCSLVKCLDGGAVDPTDCSCSNSSSPVAQFSQDEPIVALTVDEEELLVQLTPGIITTSSGNQIRFPPRWESEAALLEIADSSNVSSTVESRSYNCSLPALADVRVTYLVLPSSVQLQLHPRLPSLQSLGSSVKSYWTWTNPSSQLFADDALVWTTIIKYSGLDVSSGDVTLKEQTEQATMYDIGSQLDSTRIRLRVANNALVDNTTVVNVTQSIAVQPTTRSSGIIELQLTFPLFSQSLDYDPDLAILFGVDEQDEEEDGDGDDSDDPLQLLLLLLLGLIPFLVLVVVSFGIAYLVWRAIKHRNRRVSQISAVNF